MVYHTFCGIDIEKFEFVVNFHGSKEIFSYPNTNKGFNSFYNQNKSNLKECFIVLETTGGYEDALLKFMLMKKLSCHRADTRKVKHYIRSIGRYSKTDALDAKGLAKYASERHTELKLYESIPITYEDLKILTECRTELVQLRVAEKNRSQAPMNEKIKSLIVKHVDFLSTSITEIEEALDETVARIPDMSLMVKELMTIAGIGKTTAIGVLASVPELGKISGKEITSLCGLAPHPRQSGTKQGYASTRCGGRRQVRTMLFLPAMTATRGRSKLAEFYNGLVKRGKKKMVALVATMRKMLIICNAKMRDFFISHPPQQT